MYALIVFLLMLMLPAGSVFVEYLRGTEPLMMLVGKWFVFWSAGVRLLLAGLRQFFQPRFTSEQVFGNKTDEALPVVRELGVANFATGLVGAISPSTELRSAGGNRRRDFLRDRRFPSCYGKG
jgi:hypothetical protein